MSLSYLKIGLWMTVVLGYLVTITITITIWKDRRTSRRCRFAERRGCTDIEIFGIDLIICKDGIAYARM